MTKYTVHQLDGCTYVTGSLPITDLVALTRSACEDAVMSTDLAELLGANVAWGRKAAVDQLVARLRESRLSQDPPAGVKALSEGVRHWIAAGEIGRSSAAIVARLTGYRHAYLRGWERWPHPLDPSDLRRCMLLLQRAPELRPRIAEMADCSAVWASIAKAWDELEALLAEEIPDWASEHPQGSAPRTYERLQQLRLAESRTPHT